jgi:hypothetical protein
MTKTRKRGTVFPHFLSAVLSEASSVSSVHNPAIVPVRRDERHLSYVSDKNIRKRGPSYMICCLRFPIQTHASYF